MSWEATDDNFDTALDAAPGPVLVKFHADWCQPCKVLGPMINELAAGYEELTVVSVDVDGNPQTPARYGVRGLPTLVLLEHGNVLSVATGMMTREQLTSFLSNNGVR